MTLKFSDVTAERPTLERIASVYASINTRLDHGEISGAVAAWEKARRDAQQWSDLVHLRFEQDTGEAARKAELDYRDQIWPTFLAHETAFKLRLLAHGNRDAVEQEVGAHALRLWQTDVTTFRPEIEADLQAEAKLQSRYTALLASAKIEIEGKVTNLSGLAPYQQNLNRDIRHRAEQARWKFFEENAAQFDEI